MRNAVLLLSLMAAATFSWVSGVVLAQESRTTAPGQSVIPGQYIVVLEEEVRDPTAVAREHGRRHGARVLDTYQHSLEGYVASIPETALYLSSHTRARPAAIEFALEKDAAGTGTVSEDGTEIRRLDASGY